MVLDNPANIYLFKVNNKNTRKWCEICSKLTIKRPERRRRSGLFIVNFEHISHLFLVFLLLTLKKQMLAGKHTQIQIQNKRGNHASFMEKELSKAIINRSKMAILWKFFGF